MEVKQLALKDNLRLVVFSFLTGSELYHKISVLNKETREGLPDAKLLD